MLDITSLNVSFTFVAICALAPFLLTAWVGFRRGKTGILRGHGDDAELFLRSRIHGNFIETAPIVAMVLLVAEAAGVADGWLWLSVALYFVGRVLHGLRFDHKDRAFGMTLSTGPAMVLGIIVLTKVL